MDFYPISDNVVDALNQNKREVERVEICIVCGVDFFPMGREIICSDYCRRGFEERHRKPTKFPVLGLDRPYIKRKVGEKYLDQKGYVLIKTRTGTVPEHRIVMALKLGRDLRRGESVHHKDGIRHNNAEENLELWIGGVRYGQRAIELTCPHCGKSYLVE